VSSAFTHFIVLLVALGYKIVIKSIRKYHVKLALALFLYIITLAMKLITIYIRQDHKVSPAVNFITQFPVALINSVIFFWTVLAFKRTLSYLQQKKQDYKYQILYQLYVSFVFSLTCTVVL
jgi:purine-cytosine permease-like protein